MGDFHDERLKMAKMVFRELHMPSGSKSSSVSLYDRRFEIMAIEVSAVAAILDFSKHLKIAKWHFAQLLIALRVEIELRFTLRSTVSEIMAIEVSTMAAILDFSKHPKMAFWAIAYSLGVEIELRFALRSTVSEIMAIEVLAK